MSEFTEIKSISIETIEEVIADSFSKLTNQKYDCYINNITYDGLEGMKFEVKVGYSIESVLNKSSEKST